jgi:colicin import membrane protein
LAVSAKPTSKASSTSDSVTIPLILRQQQPPKKPEPPKPAPAKPEPKSPQDILEEATPVAMKTTDAPVNVPSLEPPPAPTLEPAFPTAPELFVPELTAPLPPPKPQVAEPKPQPKKLPPAPVATPEPIAQPALVAEPNLPTPAPREKPRAVEMQPVEDVKPPAPREGRNANPPALAAPEKPAAKPRSVEMQPVEDFKPGSLREGRDGKPPSFRCFVRDVMAFYDRTHVRCYNKVQGKVNYFAVDTNQPVAETVLTKALAAMKSGKPITIVFAPGTDLNPSNCGKKDCRRLIDIEN